MQDETLDLAVGLSARTKVWKNERWSWSALVAKLSTPHRTHESYREFIAASKDEQSRIKDVGGYVGGYLRQGRRKPDNVAHRQLLTLDIDFAHAAFWDDLTLQLDNAAVVHSTHKHNPAAPRYRLLMPLSREATPDEYVAVARRIAGTLGIELFDNTTFEPNRLMYWPSCPKDGEFYYRHQQGPWVDVDATLALYPDWRDSSCWPTAERVIHDVADASRRQADPDQKRGVVGAFCRTYDIHQAISTFLPDLYLATTFPDRYTYAKGTTAAGLLVYDDKFAFSHHGTDPTSGKLCNAFDLVRIHLYGHLDTGSDAPTKSQSYKAMEEMARQDDGVRRLLASERLSESRYDFASETEDQAPVDTDWAAALEVDAKGKYLSSATNLNVIFASDPRLKGLFRQNEFDGKRYVFGDLPWRTLPEGPEPMRNVDYAGVRNYIETVYEISGAAKVDDALALEFEKYSFHPIVDYLDALRWDGAPRIDTLLIEFFGAEDNIYTREAIRKMLVGAVARVLRPGCKFDLVLTLVGDQGVGKSTLIAKLGKQWFSDTFMTVQGKEALEQIQGAWLIEMAELAGLRKAEVEAVKHFISKQEDMFRPAYARTSETFKRQCVFFGTTNSKDFLRDPSGNRRFMPIDIRPEHASADVFNDLEPIVDQVWAEAVHLYRKGERLYLSAQAEALARIEQHRHSEVDDRRGLVEQYLDRLLPTGWEDMDIYARRSWLDDPLSTQGSVPRQGVCIAELWVECLGKSKDDMNRYNTRDLNDIMRSLPEWEPISSTKTFPPYGKQKYYQRRPAQP
jgi:predicted P-loop ATPase